MPVAFAAMAVAHAFYNLNDLHIHEILSYQNIDVCMGLASLQFQHQHSIFIKTQIGSNVECNGSK